MTGAINNWHLRVRGDRDERAFHAETSISDYPRCWCRCRAVSFRLQPPGYTVIDPDAVNTTRAASTTTHARTMPRPVQSIPAIAKAANGAIVTIITAVNDKPIAQGTGFLVSADGVIVTNYHVIETGNVAIVKFPDGTVFPR